MYFFENVCFPECVVMQLIEYDGVLEAIVEQSVFTSQHKRERGDFVKLPYAQVSFKRRASNSDGGRDDSSAALAGCCRCAASRKEVRCDTSQIAMVRAKR